MQCFLKTIFFIFTITISTTVYASNWCIRLFDKQRFEFPKQYNSYEKVDVNEAGYNQTRPLLIDARLRERGYELALKSGFVSDLNSLNIEAVWLDSGAGSMKAIHQYVEIKGEDAARVVADRIPKSWSI